MLFSRYLGVDPVAEAQTLIAACKTGKRNPLIVGGETIGGSKALWIVDSVNEERTVVDNTGATISARVSVSMSLAPDPPVLVATTGNVPKANITRKRVG